MIVQCEHCRTKFRLADDRVTGKGVKVRCSKCAHVFTVHGPHEPQRVEANLLDPSTIGPAPPVSQPPSHSGDLMAALDGLMRSSQSPGAMPSGLGGGRAGSRGTGAGMMLGGTPPAGPGALDRPPSALANNPAAGLLPDPAWLAAVPAIPPPSLPPFGQLPRPAYELGPRPSSAAPPPPTQRASIPSIPAGRPPPGQALPSVPRALLDSDGKLDPRTSGRLRALAEADSNPIDDADRTREAHDEIARAAAVLRGEEPLDRLPTQVEPASQPPTPAFDLGRLADLEVSRLPAFEPDRRASAPSTDLLPRTSWGIELPAPSPPPIASSSQSIRAPTFPPPPVFDPFPDMPQGSLPPPMPPSLPPPALEPPAPPARGATRSEARTDQFILGPGHDDPFAGLGEAFDSAQPPGPPSREFDIRDIEEEDSKHKIARLDLKKGLLGQAGVVTFGDTDAETRIAGARSRDISLDDDDVREKRKSPARTIALLGVLAAAAIAAVINLRSSHETRIGALAMFDSPSLVPGAIAHVEAEQARVTPYPPRDSSPRLVVSGRAVNRGETLGGDVEVVALMLDGDRVVDQRHAPLGALLPLDALAKAKTAAEVDGAWSQAQKTEGPWNRGESRAFMVVFPSVPSEVRRYTFRVEFRRGASARAP